MTRIRIKPAPGDIALAKPSQQKPSQQKPSQEGTDSQETAARPDRSTWIAAGIVIALVVWMGSGLVFPADEEERIVRDEPVAPVAVSVRESQAEPVEQIFIAEGQALPVRDTVLRAEMSGEIVALEAQRGDDVAQGTVIARFDAEEREAARAQAEAELERAERELDQAETLLDRGTGTLDRVVNARTARAAAQASLVSARRAERHTAIRASFDGRLDDLDIEVGEFVSAGETVGRLIDLDPLRVEIRVPQQVLRGVRPGMPAQVRFITGEVAEGEIRFVGAAADPQTRTFPAEIAVSNPDSAIPAGISAQVRIPTGETMAHFLSPATLALATDGRLVVKIVDDEDHVIEHEVSIVRAQSDGVHVSGLPDTARVITIGQGFVNEGDRVAPSEDPRAPPSPDDREVETRAPDAAQAGQTGLDAGAIAPLMPDGIATDLLEGDDAPIPAPGAQ
jgi:multidrug efflux system membrane fusion protein